MTPEGYSRGQIVAHWLVAALIVLQFLLADGMEEAWEVVEEGGAKVFTSGVILHIAIGLGVLVLAAWRLLMRARLGTPAAVADEHKALQMLAALTHVVLYALMVLLPVSGMVAWAGGIEAAAEAHQVMKVLLLVFVALHVAGALYHQFFLHSGVLDRMRTPRR